MNWNIPKFWWAAIIYLKLPEWLDTWKADILSYLIYSNKEDNIILGFLTNNEEDNQL